MSLEKLETEALRMPRRFRAALAELLLRSVEESEDADDRPIRTRRGRESGEDPSSATRSKALKTLFAAWDAEDETGDPQELEARQEAVEEFRQAMNANRSSERSLYP